MKPSSYRRSNSASKNSRNRRRLKRRRKRSESVSSSSSKRSLNDQLNLPWCPTKAMATCRWWLHSCNLIRRLNSSRIHSPNKWQAFLETRLETIRSATWCQASSKRSWISSRSRSRTLHWASLNLLSRSWTPRQTCKTSKLLLRSKSPNAKPSRVKTLSCLLREREAKTRTIKSNQKMSREHCALPLPHSYETSL